MAALASVLPILASMAPDAASSCVASAVAALVQQAVERIARMRQVKQPLGLVQASSQSLIYMWKGLHGCEVKVQDQLDQLNWGLCLVPRQQAATYKPCWHVSQCCQAFHSVQR